MDSSGLKGLQTFLNDANAKLAKLLHNFGVKGTAKLMDLALLEQECYGQEFTTDNEHLQHLDALGYIEFDAAAPDATVFVGSDFKYTWDGYRWHREPQ